MCKDHGYIAGEHFTCPECGGQTEVYSRITGYYRPVQNWNDGKTQEFKDRTVYNLGASHLKSERTVSHTVADGKHEAAPKGSDGARGMLFST